MKRIKTLRKGIYHFIAFIILVAGCLLLDPPVVTKAAGTCETFQLEMLHGQSEMRNRLYILDSFRRSPDAWLWNEDSTAKVDCSGLPPFTYDYGLEKIAIQRAEDIAVSYGFTRPNGEFAGTLYPEGSDWGESIAIGYMTAEDVLKAWCDEVEDYADQSNRRNILCSRYNYVGFGHVRFQDYDYWVAAFSATPISLVPTEANDALTKVSVDISLGMILKEQGHIYSTYGFLEGDCPSITVGVGGSEKLPLFNRRIWVYGHLPSGANYGEVILDELLNDPGWTCDDPGIATIDKDVVRGLSVGNSLLHANNAGISFPVYVRSDIPVEPDDKKDYTVSFYVDNVLAATVNADAGTRMSSVFSDVTPDVMKYERSIYDPRVRAIVDPDWYVNPECTDRFLGDTYTTTVNSDMKFYTFTKSLVKVVINGETYGTATITDSNGNVTVGEYVRTGYSFPEWMKSYYIDRSNYTSTLSLLTQGYEIEGWYMDPEYKYPADNIRQYYYMETIYGRFVKTDYKDSPDFMLGYDCRWNVVNGKAYWYEKNIKQGTFGDPAGVIGDGTVRGREIYDPLSDGWYWLDSIYDGAKAVGKEVWMPYIYQNELSWDEAEMRRIAYESDPGMGECVLRAMLSHSGKWVRYDQNGRMLKGWITISGELAILYPEQAGFTYYYDHRTGLMAKGYVTIEGVEHYFDEVTGVKQW